MRSKAVVWNVGDKTTRVLWRRKEEDEEEEACGVGKVSLLNGRN